jgi:hypothetical protein
MPVDWWDRVRLPRKGLRDGLPRPAIAAMLAPRPESARAGKTGNRLKRLAQINCRDLQRFAVFRNGAPCDHEALFRQQFGYAAV